MVLVPSSVHQWVHLSGGGGWAESQTVMIGGGPRTGGYVEASFRCEPGFRVVSVDGGGSCYWGVFGERSVWIERTRDPRGGSSLDVTVAPRDGTTEVGGLVPRPLLDELSGLGEWVFWNESDLETREGTEAWDHRVFLRFWSPSWATALLWPAVGHHHAVRLEGRHRTERADNDVVRLEAGWSDGLELRDVVCEGCTCTTRAAQGTVDARGIGATRVWMQLERDPGWTGAVHVEISLQRVKPTTVGRPKRVYYLPATDDLWRTQRVWGPPLVGGREGQGAGGRDGPRREDGGQGQDAVLDEEARVGETGQRKSLKRGAGKTSDVMGALLNGAMCGKSCKNWGVREGPRRRVMRGRRTKGAAGEDAILQLGVVQAVLTGAEGGEGGKVESEECLGARNGLIELSGLTRVGKLAAASTDETVDVGELDVLEHRLVEDECTGSFGGSGGCVIRQESVGDGQGGNRGEKGESLRVRRRRGYWPQARAEGVSRSSEMTGPHGHAPRQRGKGLRDGVPHYLLTVPAKYRSTVPYYVPPILPRARSLSSFF